MLEYPIFFFSPSTWIFFNTSSIFWKCVFTLLFWMSNRGDYFWSFYMLFVFCGWEVTLMCFTSIKIFLSQILRQVPRAWGDWVSPLLVLSPAPGYYRPSLLKKIAISFPLAILPLFSMNDTDQEENNKVCSFRFEHVLNGCHLQYYFAFVYLNEIGNLGINNTPTPKKSL